MAAAFLMAARMLLSSSLFLLARMCVPTCHARRAISQGREPHPHPWCAAQPSPPFGEASVLGGA